MQRAVCLILPIALSLGCVPAREPNAIAPLRTANKEPPATPSSYPLKLASQYLPNAIQIHPKVISGGLPEGDDGFRELAERGVKSIVCVDGAKPDVEAARKFGLRYVHLPHGYDGIPNSRAQELAKAVRDLEGPIYIHCHHGQHRSPVAAVVACVATGLISPDEVMPILTLAGTSRNYLGLYESARNARPIRPQVLDNLNVEFREAEDIPRIAEAMVALERVYDEVHAGLASVVETTAKHSDQARAHAVLLLREQFSELMRLNEVLQQPPPFEQLLQDSEAAARELHAELTSSTTVGANRFPSSTMRQLAERIATNCKQCHAAFRDAPRLPSAD